MPGDEKSERLITRLRNLMVTEVSPVEDGANMKTLLVLKQAELAPKADMSRAELAKLRDKRAISFGIEVVGDSNLTFPDGYPEDLEKYADPVNLKYRLDDEAHAANARTRFPLKPVTYDSEKSKAVIVERIVRAALAFGASPSFDPGNPLDRLLPADLQEQLTEKQMSKPDVEAEAAAKAKEEEAAEKAAKEAEEAEAAAKAKAEEGDGAEAEEAAKKAKAEKAAEEEEAAKQAKAKEAEEAEAAAKAAEEAAGEGEAEKAAKAKAEAEEAEKQDHSGQMRAAIQLLEAVAARVAPGKTLDPASASQLKKAIEILKASMTSAPAEAKKAEEAEAEAAEKAGRQQMSVARGTQAMKALSTLVSVIQAMIPEAERKGWPARKSDDQVAEAAEKSAELEKAAGEKAAVDVELEKSRGEVKSLRKQLKAAEEMAAPSNARRAEAAPTEKAVDDSMPYDANDPDFLNS